MPIKSVFLSNGEKATSIAFLDKKIIVVSSSEHVSESSLPKIKFTFVRELEGKKMAHLSAINSHCMEISHDRRVFGSGGNSWGGIGIGEGKSSADQFVEIQAF